MRHTAIAALLLGAAAIPAAAESIPWSDDFSTEPAEGVYTIINANGDSEKWMYSSDYSCMWISYNGDIPMDDWLVTPGFDLQGGKVYKFSLEARRAGLGTEKFEVLAGKGPEAGALTIPVIGETVVKSDRWTKYEGEFVAPTDGTVYIGVHGISAADQLYLYVDNLSLVSGVNSASPAAVEGLTVTPDAEGFPSVDISFTLPTADATGKPLTAIDRTEIYIDDTLLTTVTGKAPGAAVSYTHSQAPNGEHTYMAVCYAGGERGREASQTVFTGPRKPAEVTGLKAVETADGEVLISWEAARDVNGNAINPQLVTYKVVQNVPFQGSLFTEEDIEGADALTATSFTHHPLAESGSQIYVSYGVYAQTAAGTSKCVKLPLFPVGTPAQAPYRESFADGAFSSLMRSETVSYSQIATSWDPYTDEATDRYRSVDADNGFIVMAGTSCGDCARLYTGKISLSGVTDPALTFFLYNDDQPEDTNTIEVYGAAAGGQWRLLKDMQVRDLNAPGWGKVIVPLADLDADVIQLAIQGTVGNHTLIAVDDIRVATLPNFDLAAESLEVPEKVVAGTQAFATARVANYGSHVAEGFTITLYEDGEVADRVDAPRLESGEVAFVPIPIVSDVFTDGTHSYYVTVDAEDDDLTNNTTATADVEFIPSCLPAPQNLEGKAEGKRAELTWSVPDLSLLTPDAVTDDFESYGPFAQTFGSWTTVDADGNQIGRFQGIVFPGINDNSQGGQSASFWILDSAADGLDASFASHSGEKCMVQMFNYQDRPCDDWAISPELFGGAQTISFFARSYSSYFAETMEVLYSTTGTDIADFRRLAAVEVPSAWTAYSYDLPEGVRYFAVRCTSVGQYMLMTDDFTYIPAEGTSTVSVTGYSVYRDRQPLATVAADVTEYTDETASAGDHIYHVLARYDAGMSAPSNGVTLHVVDSGVGEVETGISVAAVPGAIRIADANGERAEVFTPAGLLVAAADVDGIADIPVAAGVYLVRIAGRSVKLAVK